MRRLLSIITAFLFLPAIAGAAYLYDNDFSGLTEPPSSWTERVSVGTTDFFCDDWDFAPEVVGGMSVESAQHPATVWTYDGGGAWQSYAVIFDRIGSGFWCRLEVYVRYDERFDTFYKFEYARGDSTFKIFKDSSELQSVYEDINDSDTVKVTVEGSTSATITVYVNDVQKIQAVDSSSPYTVGTFGLGLNAMMDYGSDAVFIDNLIVDEIVEPTPTPVPSTATAAELAAGFRAFRSFRSFMRRRF